MGKIGTWGKYQRNLYRDLSRALRRATGIEPTLIDVPVRIKKATVIRKWPVISISECLYALREKNMLAEFAFGDISSSVWWSTLFKEPGFEAIASEFAHCDPDSLVPLRLHGDEGRFHVGKLIMVFSYSGFRHCNDVFKSRLLSTVCPASRYAYGKKKVQGMKKSRWMKINQTFRAISQFLLWDMQNGQRGIFPAKPYVWISYVVHVHVDGM